MTRIRANIIMSIALGIIVGLMYGGTAGVATVIISLVALLYIRHRRLRNRQRG